jgi:hypothetical protein
MTDLETIARKYVAAFNERRLEDAAAMLAVDAVLQHRPGVALPKGPAGYLESAHMAISSFPDLHFEILHLETRGNTIIEIDVSATGTHARDWTAETLGTVKATGQPKTFRVRETLEIRSGTITFSSLTYELQDIIGK